MSLRSWGWTEAWDTRRAGLAIDAGQLGRITRQDRRRWTAQTASGAVAVRATALASLESSPVVGDWVVVAPGPTVSDPYSLLAIVPRKSTISRGAAGTGAVQQVLAANVDTVWIVESLDVPPNLGRLERYLAVAWGSGAMPCVVLTKADLAGPLARSVAEVRRAAAGVPVRVVSARDEDSVEELRRSLKPGETAVLLGPSGVGKSTLVNLLSQASVATTREVRARDRKGRHTTTRRELFQIPGGALLVDTPGLRELRVWDLGHGLDRAFPGIEELALACRFSDCRHESEPGCAVLEAVATGKLDAARLASFRKLRAEAAFEARKADPRARAMAVAKHKTDLKTLKYHPKYSAQE